MFGKLLKAQWRSSRRVLLTLCAVILISGILLGLLAFTMFRLDGFGMDSTFWSVVLVLLIFTAMAAVSLSCGASLFYVLWRFYKSHFTEEGYLTYTLPVTHHQLLLSSILESVLEMLLVLLAVLVAILCAGGIFALGLPWEQISADFWETVQRHLYEMWREFQPVSGAVFQGLGLVALKALSLLLTLMLSITIGSIIAKKHPILVAILVYYGINIVQFFITVPLLMQEQAPVVTAVNLLSLAVILGSYWVMYYLTSRKLNLN